MIKKGKNTMNTTLQQLPTIFKESGNQRMANWIVRYQKFTIKAAIKNAPDGYSEKTLQSYMTYGSQYLKNGKKVKLLKFLYPYLDKALQQHIQPLTPSIAEQKRVFKNDFTKKDNTPPVAKLACVTKPLTAKIQYGIRFDDTIKIFESEEAASWFNKGIEFAKGEAGKVVTVELGEV